MTKELVLSGKEKVSLVDDDIYESLLEWNWCFDGRYVYRRQHIRMEGRKQIVKKIYLHKLINQTPQGFDTDHIDGNKLNNTRANLRTTTRSQNNANQRKTRGTSKYKGVHWHEHTGKWKAEIKMNGKAKHLGLFDSEEEAAQAYNNAAELRFGSYAKTNNF